MKLVREHKGLGAIDPAAVGAIGSAAVGIFQGIFGGRQRRREIKAQLEMARLNFKDNERERAFQKEVLKANQEFQRELNAQNINLHNIRTLNNLLDLDSQVIQTQKSELNNIIVNVAPMLKYVCHRFLATKTEELEDKIVEISNQYRVYLRNTLDVYVNFSNDEHELLKELENTIQKKNNLKPIFPTELFQQNKDYTLVGSDFYNQIPQNFLKTVNFEPFKGGNSTSYRAYRRHLFEKYLGEKMKMSYYVYETHFRDNWGQSNYLTLYERSGQEYGGQDMVAYEYFKKYNKLPNEEEKLSFYEKVREAQHAKKIQELNENINRIKKILGEKKSYSDLAQPINEIKNFYVQNQEALADYSFRDKFIRGAYFLYLLLNDIGENPWNTLAVLYYYNQVRGVANYYPNASVIQKVYTDQAQDLYAEFFAFISKNRIRYYDYSDNAVKEWINEQELPFFIKGMVMEGNLGKSKSFFDQYYLMERQSKEYKFIKETLDFTTACFDKEQEFLAGLFFDFILKDIKFSKQEVIPELIKVFQQFNQRFTEYMNLDKQNRIYRKLSKANKLKTDFVSAYKNIGLTPLAILDETNKGFEFDPEHLFKEYLKNKQHSFLFSVSQLNTLASKLLDSEQVPDVRSVKTTNMYLRLPSVKGYVGKDLFTDESYFEFLRIFEEKIKTNALAKISAKVEMIKKEPWRVASEDQKKVQGLLDAFEQKKINAKTMLSPNLSLKNDDIVNVKIKDYNAITIKDYLNLVALLTQKYPSIFKAQHVKNLSAVTLRNKVYKSPLINADKEQKAVSIAKAVIHNDALRKAVFEYVVSSKEALIVIGDYAMDLEVLDRVKTLYKQDWQQKNQGLLYEEAQRKKYQQTLKNKQEAQHKTSEEQTTAEHNPKELPQNLKELNTTNQEIKTLNPIVQRVIVGAITYWILKE